MGCAVAELTRADFAPFVEEVNGFSPFPWQTRLLEEVLGHGWPDLLDLPTGVGKTSALLVALFALALKPEQSPRRMVLVVDRRIIVDQVNKFETKIVAALDSSEDAPVCRRVAERLQGLCSATKRPLRSVLLRGGIPRDDTWISSPNQPMLIASTVDQVGSRLLFRGYGVSDSMRPVHAGLLGRDTIFFLDEVQLATAFEQTLVSLRDAGQRWPEHHGIGRPLTLVRMSATPRDAEASSECGQQDERAKRSLRRFELKAADRNDPVLSERLDASRPATLELVATKTARTEGARDGNRKKIAEAASRRALEAAEAGATRIGVILNRVDTARRTAKLLTDAKQVEAKQGEVLLLTGRMRQLDRVGLQKRLMAVAGSSPEPRSSDTPSFVVATSTIEAGADVDFEVLVTEVASLDALRQRFGRLNRLGRTEDARAWILGARDQMGKDAEDPIYGTALKATWAYLNELLAARSGDTVEFCLSAFPNLEPKDWLRLVPEPKVAPLLFPNYLDMWSETRPQPHPSPDPTLWLHGKDADPDRDVSVVFRGDVISPPVEKEERERVSEQMHHVLEFLPPVVAEAVEVPHREFVGQWLCEGERVWRWTADDLEPVGAAQIRPGDTLVVPAQRGGLRLDNWDPKAEQPVTDIAELATREARGLLKLRLDPATLPAALVRGDLPRPPNTDDPEEYEASQELCVEWLRASLRDPGPAPRDDGGSDGEDGGSASPVLPDEWRSHLEELLKAQDAKHTKLDFSESYGYADGKPVWWLSVRQVKGTLKALDATTEDEVSAFSGVEVELVDHLNQVEAWVGRFAQHAGLSPALTGDLALAGKLHDIGKADLRFQAYLHGGDPIRAAGGTLLGKSGRRPSARDRKQARKRSGWQSGMRHELVSLALLEATPQLAAQAHDLDLVRHLVASHHGWCRPWPPAKEDAAPRRVTLELDGVLAEASTAALDGQFFADCAARFRRLCRRYGWHGLAYLEALLRLADHRASAQPGYPKDSEEP